MTSDREERLVDAFPSLFANWGKPGTPLGEFGIECGDGWFQIVWDMCTAMPDVVHIVQIKRKLGELHVYFDGHGGDMDIHWVVDDIISRATERSRVTCETCGRRKKKEHVLWNSYQVVCVPCRDDRRAQDLAEFDARFRAKVRELVKRNG